METYFGEIKEAHNLIARERVLTDLKTLARDSEDLLRVTAHGAGDKAREARARLSAALERAKASCAEWSDQAVTSAQAAARTTDRVIRQHPYQSIGIAFGIGLLVGVLASPRDRNPPEST